MFDTLIAQAGGLDGPVMAFLQVLMIDLVLAGDNAVAVGLAQNMGALRALATEGIQRGHMALHARNIALVAGATGDEIDRIASRMASEKDVRTDRAVHLLAEIRGQ